MKDLEVSLQERDKILRYYEEFNLDYFWKLYQNLKNLNEEDYYNAITGVYIDFSSGTHNIHEHHKFLQAHKYPKSCKDELNAVWAICTMVQEWELKDFERQVETPFDLYWLPDQLEPIRCILYQCIEKGIISNDYIFEWKQTGQLLAYFCQEVSHKFNLSKKRDKEDKVTVNWSIFNKLFNKKNIKSYKNDWLKINPTFYPNGYEIIDSILNQATPPVAHQ